MAPTPFKVLDDASISFIQYFTSLINTVKQDQQGLLNFFLGWRIWKMRNSILFQQKRPHILQAIHGAIREHDQWKEATQKSNQIDQNTRQYRQYKQQAVNIQEGIPQRQPFTASQMLHG